jgi:hypothetical protein
MSTLPMSAVQSLRLGHRTGPHAAGHDDQVQLASLTGPFSLLFIGTSIMDLSSRRNRHPAVADRHEVGLAGDVLLLEQRNRFGPEPDRPPAPVT